MARYDDARAHFEEALAANERMAFLPWLAHTQSDYARMLLARNASGDRVHARDLIGDALAIYRKLGMDSWAQHVSRIEHSARATAQRAGP